MVKFSNICGIMGAIFLGNMARPFQMTGQGIPK